MFELLLLIIILIIAVVSDIRFMRIPNWLTIAAFILAVSYNSLVNGLSGFYFALEGACLGIALLLIPYLMGRLGAGDAKLMGAVGALLGPKGVFLAFLLTALIGGVYAAALLAFYGGLEKTLRRYWLTLGTFFVTGKLMYLPPSAQETLPRLRYGVAIALGTIVTVVMKNNIYELLHFD